MSASFSEWIEAVFDHVPGEPEWFWADTFDSEWEALGLSDGVTVDYLHHWHLHYPDEVEAIVDGFLAKTPGLTLFIREYAGAARKGCAQ